MMAKIDEPGVICVAGFFLSKSMEYSIDYFKEMMRWLDPGSIVVIEGERTLKRIYCPFRVLVIIPVGTLAQGDIVIVEAVKITLELLDVYIISKRAYYVRHFQILT